MRQGYLHLKNGREIAVQSFLQQYHQRYIIIVTFLNVQYPIDPAVSQPPIFAVCIASRSAL